MNIIFLSVTMQMRIELNHDITNTLPAQLQLDIDLQSMLFRASILQGIAYGCCDFIAQCTLVHKFLYLLSSVLIDSPKSSKIYRCWIVWSKNIRFVIIPSFLAIAYIGQ